MRCTCLMLCLAAGLLAVGVPAGAADQNALAELIKKADVIVVGQVARVTQGALDPELLKINVKFRTDTAAIAVRAVVKGDPGMKSKTINVVFPGFPKPGQPTLAMGQSGVWLLTKSDQPNAYEMKTEAQHLPDSKVADVRRAALIVSGVDVTPPEENKAEQVKKARAELRTSTSPVARRLAAYQLGELGEPESVTDLITALDDDSSSVRFAADVALRKLTGYRVHVDFGQGAEAERRRGQAAWATWWAERRKQSRKEILAEAVRESDSPQPDFEHAIAGLAEYNDLNLVPVFARAFERAMAAKDSRLLAITARYFGRVRDRSYVAKLIPIFDGSLIWTSTTARNAAVAAVAAIVQQDFGSGRTAQTKCLEWWDKNRSAFK